jgi:RNA polymerase subunit RPABC4/transcription elongation factor Spt4
MTLIICKECNEKISNKAKYCQKCGYPKNKSNSSIWIFVAIIILTTLLYIMSSNNDKSSENNGRNIYDSAINYDWRTANSSEFLTLGKIILENEIKICGEYQVKKLNEFEYLLGCTPDGKTWHYRTVDLNKRKLYYLPPSVIEKIKAPR